MERQTTVAIIGGGAAGLTAAHFLGRAGVSAEVIDQDRSILKRARLKNLPGVAELEGRSLLADLRARAERAGSVLTSARVDDVNPADGGFTVTVGEDTVRCEYVILASGQGTVKLPSLPLATEEARQPFVKVNVVTDRWGATSIDGVWAAGVVAGWPSQASVCAGQRCERGHRDRQPHQWQVLGRPRRHLPRCR